MPQVPVESGQDWGAVNAGSGKNNARYSVPTTGRELEWAKASGKVATERRHGAGGNASRHTGTSLNARKLEESTEAGSIARVDKSLSKAIMQARMAQKMSQKDLATAINAKPQIIMEYENGKAIPNPQIISQLERKLKTKLPRSSGKNKIPAGGKGGTAGAKAKTSTLTRGGPAKRR